MKLWQIKFKAIILLIFFSFSYAQAQVSIYPAPQNLEASKDFKVKVNGINHFVYPSTIPASYCSFDINGVANIEIKATDEVKNVTIRPLSLHIKPSIKNGIISFKLDKPCKLSVELNGNLTKPLFLFANNPVKDAPARSSKSTCIFKAGKVYDIGRMVLKSKDTVYIEGGAYVKGSFFLDSVQDVKIFGHGVLDGSLFKKGQQRMIEINRCKNVSIEGITITDSKHWTVPCNLSENVTYENIKILSNNDWDDGIDIVSSKNVLVDDCFIRTKDDCIAIKAGVTYYTKFFNETPTENVTVKNSIIWNSTWGNALEIGFETRADTIKNIHFQNLDIIHVEGTEGCFTIHNGDRAVIKDVSYENINVEEVEGWLIDFRILKSNYTKDTSKGSIENVSFKNIQVKSKHYPHSQILGFDDNHLIKNVCFDNVWINNQKINSIYNGLIATIHNDELQFK